MIFDMSMPYMMKGASARRQQIFNNRDPVQSPVMPVSFGVLSIQMAL